MQIYDNAMNTNEWFVIIGFCIGLSVVLVLPKRFPAKASVVFFMCGVYSGFFFDHSLSIEPVSFYDVNDTSQFEFTDFLSYWIYGPVSYLFFYVWNYINLHFRLIPLYLSLWVSTAVGIEWLATRCGVFHYRHGYKIDYSVPIYLMTFCLWVILYRYYEGLTDKSRM